ncbi:MAG: TonB-dependent receptor [Cellvibrionaceae bacterium]|nr:TonB-dependent receptor [Cellvibrionaceae bacterium]
MKKIKPQTSKYALLLSPLFLGVSLATSAQDQALEMEEVLVTGVRAAQASAINKKRAAVSIVDAISAEDIGKLPDATITDSLQRVTGVQIRRSAGEGGLLNLRGSAQVLTTLNGESYLGANSITTVQPNFADIPSQLFSGVELAKSQTAAHTPGGITGIVDLATYRPFSFEDGLTLSGAAQLSTGAESSEADPSINGLLNWKGDRVGFLVSLSHSNANLANYYAGITGGGDSAGWSGFAGEDWAWGDIPEDSPLYGDFVADGGLDLNNDGDVGDTFWAYQGHAAYNRFVERERSGVNVSFQAEFGHGFELLAEVLHTAMDEHDRVMGIYHSDKWSRWGWFVPSHFRNTGDIADDRELSTVQTYTGNGRRVGTYSSVQATESESTNINLALNYDNGGPLRGSVRFVTADASQERLNSYMGFDLADGNQWGVAVQNYPSGAGATNPNGYAGYPVLTVDYRGSNPAWSGFENNANLDVLGNSIDGVAGQSIGAYLENVASYNLGALTSENNFQRGADLEVLRADGEWQFSEGFISSVDFGLRFSSRRVDNNEFDLLSPLGPNGCGVKWKATDVTLSDASCNWQDPNNPDIFYTALEPTPLSSLDGVLRVSDFGSTEGIPAVWLIDPAKMDRVELYHQNLYPGTYRSANPGRSYEVDFDERSYFAQANFHRNALRGNIGLRLWQADLSVLQNDVGSGNPYGAAETDLGDIKTDKSFTKVLPFLNLSFDVSGDLMLRSGVSKTTSPLDLNQWGGGLSVSYALDSVAGSPTEGQFIVVSASSNGNPNLEPWSAWNFDLSVEKYIGQASLFSAAVFYIDIDSFVVAGTVPMDLPDQDGVVRRTIAVNTSVQGDGATLKGLELSAKFDFSDYVDDGWLSYFGSDVNYTYSPSDSGAKSINGEALPLNDNSENLVNLVGWFQAGPWQARLAYNYRSERLVALNQTWGEGALWQEPTAFVDASLTYDINDNFAIFASASNLSAEKERYYLEYPDQFVWQFEYEPRYTLGIRGRF